MQAFWGTLNNPVNVAMLLLCILGTAFMIWFLGGLIAERSKVHARYVVRFELGESQSMEAFPDPAGIEPLLDAPFGDLQLDRRRHFPVHGFRIRQHF
ncbi:MAG TPA: hypothetical protein VH079_05585 [Terriglobales bacterium]|jgi:hypothetical protein|nr:hypothetical protein [Terriglobales bacterium]